MDSLDKIVQHLMGRAQVTFNTLSIVASHAWIATCSFMSQGPVVLLSLACIMFVVMLLLPGTNVVKRMYALYAIASGGIAKVGGVSKRALKHTLFLQIVPVSELDETTLRDLAELLDNAMQTGDNHVSIVELSWALEVWDTVVIFRDAATGSARGMITFSENDEWRDPQTGRTHYILHIGLLMFHPDYRGSFLLPGVCGLFWLRQRLRHPLSPGWMMFRCFSPGSYLAWASNRHVTMYPHRHHTPPDSVRAMLRDVLIRRSREGDVLDVENFIYKREKAHVRRGAMSASVSAKASNADVLYFESVNPGWERGHQLLTCVDFGWSVLKALPVEMLSRVFGASRRRPGSGKCLDAKALPQPPSAIVEAAEAARNRRRAQTSGNDTTLLAAAAAAAAADNGDGERARTGSFDDRLASTPVSEEPVGPLPGAAKKRKPRTTTDVTAFRKHLAEEAADEQEQQAAWKKEKAGKNLSEVTGGLSSAHRPSPAPGTLPPAKTSAQ